MPDRYALDTNVYIGALRQREALQELKAFLARAGHRVVVPAVVALEIRAGAISVQGEADVQALIEEYRRRDRVIVPSFEAYVNAGRVLAALRGSTSAPSVVADALLASSCRESDVVLVTHNIGDFARMHRHLRGFRFVAPWPLIRR